MLGISCMFQSCKSEFDEIKAVSNEVEIDRRKYDINLVDENIASDFKLVDGILHFKNFEAFRKTCEGLDKISLKEKIAFSEIKGLNSRLGNTQVILEKINNAKSNEERERIILANSEVVFKDRNGLVMNKISDDCTSALVTNEGMVYIGKMLYMFTPDAEYIVYDGDKSRLTGVKNGRKINESEVLSIINTSTKASKSARLYVSLGAEVQSNVNNTRGKMYTIVDSPEFFPSGNNLYQIRVHSYSKAQALSNPLGSYAPYSTSHIFSVNYSIKMYSGLLSPYVTYPFTGYSPPSSTTLNSPYTWSDSRSGSGSSIDFHFYDYAYDKPYSLRNNMSVLIETEPTPSTVFANFQHRYNYAELGPGQWIYPDGY